MLNVQVMTFANLRPAEQAVIWGLGSRINSLRLCNGVSAKCTASTVMSSETSQELWKRQAINADAQHVMTGHLIHLLDI